MSTDTPSFGFAYRLHQFFMTFFSSHSKHVRISAKGRRVLGNRQLVRKVVDAVIEHKNDLDKGGSVTVKEDGTEIELSLAGTTEQSSPEQ